jgi:hypothetical protein
MTGALESEDTGQYLIGAGRPEEKTSGRRLSAGDQTGSLWNSDSR